MGAFIYSNKVSRIVELENEYERERTREFLMTVGCLAMIAAAAAGFMFRIGLL